MANQDDAFGLSDDAINGKTPPSRKVVDWLHTQVSTEKDTDLHHRIGFGETDASRGDHDHDGENSMPLWDENEVVLNTLAGGATLGTVIDRVNEIILAMRQKGAGGT
jgi:hypothetical protein